MFTVEEREAIIHGLYMRKNIIETGNPHLCAKDVQNMGPQAAKENNARINGLGIEQMKFIIMLDGLIKKLMNM